MLDATLDAAVTDERVALSLTVENPGSEPVTLSFRDDQRAEFVAERADDGTEVWRWSDGRMFAMATGSETLDRGASATYEATWPDPPSGEFDLRARVVATDAEAAAAARVSVP